MTEGPCDRPQSATTGPRGLGPYQDYTTVQPSIPDRQSCRVPPRPSMRRYGQQAFVVDQTGWGRWLAGRLRATRVVSALALSPTRRQGPDGCLGGIRRV